jgi:hypothetical protein
VEVFKKHYRYSLGIEQINDPRQPKDTAPFNGPHDLWDPGVSLPEVVLKRCNKEKSTAIFFKNIRAKFPDYETMPHADTLSSSWRNQCGRNQESIWSFLNSWLKGEEFRNYLINKRYVIAIDGPKKFMRTEPWSEEPLVRHVGKEKQAQY